MDLAAFGLTSPFIRRGPGSLDCRACADIFSSRCEQCEHFWNSKVAANDPLNSETLKGWIEGTARSKTDAAASGLKSLLQLLEGA
jgi:hypothetical protein